jgi:phosphoribosylaminoimidazole-succinocarboxamide synthase
VTGEAPVLRGKVREVYRAGDGRLAMVASDRISAYDVILPTPIPDKGRVLTGLSRHWFAQTADIVPNHLLSTRPADMPAPFRAPEFAGRTMLVRRLEMLPIECVARGYLVGSGWRDYRETGAVCGHPLPAGLDQADRLAEPIFTPATKADSGHDENITREEAADLVGGEVLAEVERITLALYTRAAAACAAAGIILADTKFELGRDPATGELVLGDEAVTPDSSRLWPAGEWRRGINPPSFDKQYVRDWLDASGWDHSPPGPELPDDVVAGTRARYVDAYERITGESFADYLRECE